MNPKAARGTKRHRRSQVAQALAAIGARKSWTTLLCASRFCEVPACVKVSEVTWQEACRSNSCITLMSTLWARSRDEYVRRKPFA